MTPVDEKKPDLMPFERHPRLAKILQHYATHSTGCSQLQWQELLDSINEAITTPAQRPTDKDAQEALEILEGKYFWNGLQYIKDFIGDRRYEVIRAALSAPSREAKLVEALRVATKGCEKWLDKEFGPLDGPHPGMRQEVEKTIIQPLREALAAHEKEKA